MHLRPAFFVFVFAGLLGCGQIPDVGNARAEAARDAPYPDLVPLAQLIDAVENTTPRITPASITSTNAKIANLRARAANLRGPVVSSATRARMRAAIARAALR